MRVPRCRIPPGVSSRSGVKREHGGSVVTDDEEQPGTRARISNLIAGPHGVDAAEDDETCSGDGINDECVCPHGTKRNADARLVASEFNTRDKRGELFAGTPGLISRAMTKCENGLKRSIMLADVKIAFLYGDARRSLYVELPPEDPLSASGRHVGKLERAMYGTRGAPIIWQDHLRETLLDMKFKESVTHMKLETFFSAYTWMICSATDVAEEKLVKKNNWTHCCWEKMTTL